MSKKTNTPDPAAKDPNWALAAWPFPKAAPRKPAEENSIESPEAGLLSNVNTDEPDTGMAGDEHPQQDDEEGERIRVDMVSLYTDLARNQVEQLAVEQLVDSTFQPRTVYDQAALEALADTMRGVGVMQPILVRPLPFDEVPLMRGTERVQAYEIVYGHRRTRAARIAQLATVPAIVRDLTNAQVTQLQSIENVQRENLKPLEEAAAYQHYLQAHGVSKKLLAKEIGRSRAHVYSRLKLLDVVDQVRDALRLGEIDVEVAGYIARLHTPKIQEKALAAIRGKYLDMADGGKKSVRQINELLREKFTLNLKEALFDTEDAVLLAGAGACTTCVKRTGNAPEYEDMTVDGENAWHQPRKGEPNLCTDPDCFEEKKKAHLVLKAEALEAKGKTVITGNKARQLVSATGDLKEGYIPLKDVRAEIAKANKGKDAPEITTAVIQNPRDGKMIEVVKVDDLTAVGVKVKATPARRNGPGRYNDPAELRRRQEERDRLEAAAQKDTRVHVALLGAVRRAAAGVPLSTLALQLAAAAALKGVDYRQHDLIATLHGFDSYDDLANSVGSMPPDRLATLLLDCGLVDDVIVEAYHPTKPHALLSAAKHYDVDVAKIRKEVGDLPEDVRTSDLLEGTEPKEGRTPAGARSQDAPIVPIKTRTASAKGSKAAASKPAATRKPKTSEAEAKRGIAHAMQGIDGAGASRPAQGDLIDGGGSIEGHDPGASGAEPNDASSSSTLLARIVNWPPLMEILERGGVTTCEQLADLDVDELIAITNHEHEAAANLILKARDAIAAGAAEGAAA